MSVLAIIAALVIEQWRPLGDRKAVQGTLAAWAGWLEQAFNGGERRHGMIAWFVAVLPPVLLAFALHAVLYSVHGLLALAFNVAVLYLTLGFRQFSHYFTAIQLAVKAEDIERARSLLEQWRGASGVVRSREEVIRLTIEEALLASHRHVFGVLLWYLLLPGPSGAVLYRLAAYFASRWKELGSFGQFAQRVFNLLEWPAIPMPASCSPPAPAPWACAWACRCRKSRACSRAPSSASASPPRVPFSTARWDCSGARWWSGCLRLRC